MGRKKIFAVFAVCAVLVCILAGVLFIAKVERGEVEVAGPKVNIGNVGKVISERFLADKGWITGKEQYLEFIAAVQAGIRDNFQTVSTEDLGICSYFMDYDKAISTLGYEFLDLDSDGVYELVIGVNDEYKGLGEVNRIFGIYRLKDGEVVPVAYVSDGESYYLCDNGYIAEEKSEDEYKRYSYYTYEGGQLKLYEMLMEHEQSWGYSEKEVSWEEAQSMNRTKALNIKYQYLYRDLSFQVFVDKDEIVKIRAEEAAKVIWPDPDNLTFADLSGIQFWHGSGAGAWSTQLIIESDGSFKGYYQDGDAMGGYYYEYTVSDCYFSGKFTNLTKIGPYEYSMKCQDFQTEGKLGEECIIGKTRYITAEPYGFLDADEVRLYLPGKTRKDLPEEYLSWCSDELEYDILTTYGLFNVGDGSGYYVYPREESVYKVGRGTEVSDEDSKNSSRSDEEVKAFINGLREDYDPESVKYSFADVAGISFWSSRNAGGSSSFEIRPDGSFYGTCGDGMADMKYTGRFSSMEKIGPSAYLLKCEYTEITEYDGAEPIAPYPYGFDFANEFILYLREKDSLNPTGAGSLYNIRGDISFVVPHG